MVKSILCICDYNLVLTSCHNLVLLVFQPPSGMEGVPSRAASVAVAMPMATTRSKTGTLPKESRQTGNETDT